MTDEKELNKPISFAEKTCNGQIRSPLETLRSVIKDIEDGTVDINKIVILGLNDKESHYSTYWWQGGMVMSECFTLCDISKIKFLYEMELIPRPNHEN